MWNLILCAILSEKQLLNKNKIPLHSEGGGIWLRLVIKHLNNFTDYLILFGGEVFGVSFVSDAEKRDKL